MDKTSRYLDIDIKAFRLIVVATCIQVAADGVHD